MPFTAPRLKLNPKQHSELEAIIRRRSVAAAVLRARIILGLAEGKSYRSLQEQLQTSAATIARWRSRFEQEGLAGLVTVHPGQPPSKLTPALRAKVLAKTSGKPNARRTAPPTGPAASWPGCWASAKAWSTASGGRPI